MFDVLLFGDGLFGSFNEYADDDVAKLDDEYGTPLDGSIFDEAMADDDPTLYVLLLLWFDGLGGRSSVTEPLTISRCISFEFDSGCCFIE